MKGRSDADKTAAQVYSTVHERRAEPHIDLTIDYLSISELGDLLIASFFFNTESAQEEHQINTSLQKYKLQYCSCSAPPLSPRSRAST